MEKDNSQILNACQNFNLEKGLIANLLKSDISQKAFLQVVKKSGLGNGQKKIGNMLYSIATKQPEILQKYRGLLAEKVGSNDIYNPNQLDYAIQYIVKAQKLGGVDIVAFTKQCGIGVKLTPQQVKQVALQTMADANNQSIKIQYFLKFKGKIPYAEGKLLKQVFDQQWKSKGFPQNNALAQKKKQKTKKPDNNKQQEPQYNIKDINELIGREMKSSLNTKENLQWRKQKFGEGVLTRFPPEPNGYLHIGHCKAMRFNFMQAKQAKGDCYLRFDDTNPCKQNIEFIENIKENIKWMGYDPFKITHSSDYFEQLYNFAVRLIKQGDAFVSSDTKEEMKHNRSEGLPSKGRDRSVEQNLRIFQQMRLGMYAEGQYSLCAKIDYKHPNTTLRDPVIYRIRYTAHPHTGNKWCIYPLYDFTHPLSDSLQGISHSLCSLEFQIRRELYYWSLDRLGLFKPSVWEYSRLNITTSVLSKRKLHELIFTNRVSGWDDPRVLTINGMRRRGYPAEAINNFCDVVGVTRRGNQNYIDFGLLQHQIRKYLDNLAPRTMAVLDPVLVIIEGMKQEQIKVPFFPKNEEKGHRIVKFASRIYVDRQNVKQVDNDPEFYGMAPNKYVGLKYAQTVFVKSVKTNDKNEIVEVHAVIDQKKTKPSSFLHWISIDETFDCQVRSYGPLFTVNKPHEMDNYLDYLNKDSLNVYKNAKCHIDILKNINVLDRWQFERQGFFCVDKDSTIPQNKIVWNKIVGLADYKKKK